jgi:hypothetical protein
VTADDASMFPESAGAILGELLTGPTALAEQDGPPWTHTFRPPDPDGYDEDGRPYWLPKPMFTIERIRGDDD